jgi:predicted nucleic acid-binding protein
VRAVDTNILARFYLRDDAVQGRIAARVLAAGDVFIPKTVVLELEWVLRYVAEQSERKVIECLAHLIALPGITVERVVRRFLYRRRPKDSKSTGLAMMALGNYGQCRLGSEPHVLRRTNMDGTEL